jgi:hypothetical protein
MRSLEKKKDAIDGDAPVVMRIETLAEHFDALESL